MRIRKFNEKDTKQVISLISNVLYEIFKVKPANIELDKGFFMAGGMLYVAEHQHEIVAVIGIKKHKNSIAKLKRFYVKKSYRGTGLAQKLYNKALSFAKTHGYTKIILSTTLQMKAAINFYQKQGFKKYRTNYRKNQIYMYKDI